MVSRPLWQALRACQKAPSLNPDPLRFPVMGVMRRKGEEVEVSRGLLRKITQYCVSWLVSGPLKWQLLTQHRNVLGDALLTEIEGGIIDDKYFAREYF